MTLDRPEDNALTGSFRVESFRWLWVSGLLSSFAMYTSVLVLSWLALGNAGSPIDVGIVLAARVLPQLLFGIPGGALADRVSRSHLVMLANVGSAAAVGLLCFAWAFGADGLPTLAVSMFLIGTCDTLRVTAASTLAFDLVGARSATNAIALSNLAAQVAGIFAGVIGGSGVATLGPTRTLVVAGIAYLAGAILVTRVRYVRPAAAQIVSGRVSLVRAATLVARHRLVAIVALVVAGTEVFAFSNMTLLPSFARDVFGVGAAGLGGLLSARAIGGTLGLVAIARTATRWRTVGSFAFLAAAFGLALIAFALTPAFGLALVLAGAIGAVGAAVDAVGQAQLQHAVPEAERGSAMGLWMFCLGLGLAGYLATGTIGGWLGAQLAQILNGVVLILLGTFVGAVLSAISTRRLKLDDAP